MFRLRANDYICSACRRAFSSSRRRAQDVRPPTAPKQYPEIAQIRRNVQTYEDNLILRNYHKHKGIPSQIAQNAEKITGLTNALEKPRKKLKELENELRSKSADRNGVLEKIRQVKPEYDQLLVQNDALDAETQSLALSLPSLTSSQTPTDGEPRLISYINYNPDQPPTYPATADHSSIGEKLSLLDFSSAATTTGWGFYYLLNEAALLEQALIQYALSVAMRRGWQLVSPPSLVYSHIADACGFQPRDQNDEQQIWQVAQSPRDASKPKRSLAATAEIPLAGLRAGKEIPEQTLPVKVIGSSRCYRAEAGARGVDTKGLYRVHEFTKVEMFAWTDRPSPSSPADTSTLPSESDWTSSSTKIFDEMVSIQTEILHSLNLACRILEMPSSDLGASAYRKIDIETMFPSRMRGSAGAADTPGGGSGWGEVTSASICTDYQSRRLNTRILEQSGARKKFPHTANGTAMAVPRVLAAILENGWRELDGGNGDGYVVVPEVLRPYMGGLERIGPKKRK